MDMTLSELRKLVMNRETWRAAINGVAKSQPWLSNWTELNWVTFWESPNTIDVSFLLELDTMESYLLLFLTFLWTSLVALMVKHLPTMWETEVQSLGHKISWRRQWQPTPVFLPGKSHRWRRLVRLLSKSWIQLSDFTLDTMESYLLLILTFLRSALFKSRISLSSLL